MKLAQKIKVLFVLFTLPVSTLTVHSKSVNETEVKLSATENYGKLPLSFEANVGQSDRSVKFLSRGKGYTVFLTPIEAVLSLRGKEQHVLRMNLVGANADARVSGEQPLEGRVNYLIGNDRTKWRTGIPTFQRIHYADVWQGIDLVWYGTQTEMEYDFVVKPGSDVAQIGVRFEGAEKLRINENAFQRSGFCIGVCGLELDRRVDAFVSMLSEAGDSLLYSTFFGGSATASASFGRAFDAGNAIAIDSSNRIYITGETASNNLPTKHAFQWSRHSEFTGTDAFIAVFNPFAANGNDTLLYSSYYGGDGDEIGRGVAVDNDRNAYIVGSTASTDLETKSPASVPLRATFQGGGFDGFVAKVDTEADGNSSLTYSTYFGGNINDRVESVAVDAQQRAYITGASNSSPSSFPLRNAFDSTQTNGEAFVAKLNADGTALFYSSFLGGDNANTSNDGEEGLGITIDFGGNAYVTGRTTSGASFPCRWPVSSRAPRFWRRSKRRSRTTPFPKCSTRRRSAAAARKPRRLLSTRAETSTWQELRPTG